MKNYLRQMKNDSFLRNLTIGTIVFAFVIKILTKVFTNIDTFIKENLEIVLIGLVVAIIVLMIVAYIFLKWLPEKKRKKNILDIYEINSRKDVWELLTDPNIPDEHKEEIRALADFMEKINKK